MKLLIISLIIISSFMNSFSQTPKKAEVVSLNGADIYYEVYGKGKPLFLLHGYTWSSKFWYPFVSDYSGDFSVYLVDLKGHGKSDQFKKTLSIKSAAEDVDALITYLKLDSIYVIGYSYGGDVMFQLALLRPGLIKSMISIGACGICNIKYFPQWVEYMSYKNIDKLPWMREHQTSEKQIQSILEQLTNYIVSVSAEVFKSIHAKTLLVIGDQEDSILWEDILRAKNNLPNSFLWVMPNTGHRAHVDKNKADFVKISREFFIQSWTK